MLHRTSNPNLEIKVNDVLLVNVGDGLDDLPHEGRASLLCQDKLVLYDPVEELTAAYAVI